MGKKGTWFSTIKRLFTSNSKHNKPMLLQEPNSSKQNRKKFKHALFREPSSIEKILGELDQNNLYIAAGHNPQPTSPPTTLVDPQTEITEPPLQQQLQLRSAIKIQVAYRTYMARRKSRAGGLERLKGVVRGQHVKRQTINAMKQMQLLVRLQTQIQSRRIQMLCNQQPPNNKQLLDANNLLISGDEDWDDSLITKEEREARLHRTVEAVVKREKAIAYAYSHQLLLKDTPKSAHNNSLSRGYPFPYPRWCKWLQRQLPSSADVKNHHPFPSTDHKRPQLKQQNNSEVKSSRSMVPPRTRHGKAIKDDDSLMSCPAFSVPNYMSPTVSAKAKARPTSNPKGRMPSTPGSSESSKRRFSQTPNINSNWKKKHKSPRSVGESSMDSALSLTVERKAFNRFV